MATVRDITLMCKEGKLQDAYNLAKTDLSSDPDNLWQQRAMGWALYYMIKDVVNNGNYSQLILFLDELNALNQLTIANDSMIFENVLRQVGDFIKEHVSLNDVTASAILSVIFMKLKGYVFNPSKGYSRILDSFIKFETWSEMADFIDWWNLDNLTSDDYVPYENKKGQKMMTLAERAYLANSKALLKQNDLGRIEAFLPKLDELMESHPEMTYPGYFYGKLLLRLGSDADEALKVIVPFARKKVSEFWVWQLLSDVFTQGSEKQLACLLRAVHCRTKESFLGKVRTRLAAWYIDNDQLDKARFHIDAITRNYVSQGWKIPNEVDYWIHQPWINTVCPDATDPIDYMKITDAIICEGTEEAVAVVTYVDQKSQKVALIYGHQQRMGYKLRFKVTPGVVLNINYITEADGRAKILNAVKTTLPPDLSYAKVVEGTISKQEDKNYAFLKSPVGRCFVSPVVAQKFKVANNEQVKALVVYDYDKKKEAWNWVCISIM